MLKKCRVLRTQFQRVKGADLRLYLVTDDAFREGLVERISYAIEGGVTCVQVRLKHESDESYAELAREVIGIARPKGVKVLVNDNVNVALVSGADGVHVGEEEPDHHAIRKAMGPGKIIGVTVYGDPALVDQAIECGADYVGTGAIFPSATKPCSVKGLESLSEVKRHLAARHPLLKLPVVAIGGITPDNARLCFEHGADSVAMVSALLNAPPPYVGCSALAAKAWSQVPEYLL
ncbi:Thiamine-phosphate synthase [Diplonema papillatum]|nr:Thiamine-phosphate synthase [Diplonema papillatum]